MFISYLNVFPEPFWKMAPGPVIPTQQFTWLEIPILITTFLFTILFTFNILLIITLLYIKYSTRGKSKFRTLVLSKLGIPRSTMSKQLSVEQSEHQLFAKNEATIILDEIYEKIDFASNHGLSQISYHVYVRHPFIKEQIVTQLMREGYQVLEQDDNGLIISW